MNILNVKGTDDTLIARLKIHFTIDECYKKPSSSFDTY